MGLVVSGPTARIRRETYERDGGRCVSCGAVTLTYQHRAAEGMGGRLARPGIVEGLAACALCNGRFEGDLQGEALALGWKVKRWVVEQSIAQFVPVFYAWERSWCRLTLDGRRVPILRMEALAMMRRVYGHAEEGI